VITPEYKALFDAGKTNEYKFCVGHNRSATSGGVVLDAAHPFTEGPITLVHNGTVKKEYTTEVELANDSHGICWRLSKDPVEEVIKSLDGAFALIWHDARDDSLNFVRNSQRPLHMAKAKGNDTIYFASEAEMLYWLDHRLTLKLQDIVSMKPAHWLKFKGPKLMVPEVKPVELYSPKAQSQTKWDSSNWSGTGQSNAGSTNPPAKNLWQKWKDGTTKGVKKKSHSPKSIGKEIPDHLQNALCDYNLFVEQEEEFVPMANQEISWHGKGREYSSIMGWIITQDKEWNPLPCVLHGVAPTVWEHAKNRIWSVNPLGMTNLGYSLPCVVARLRGTFDLEGNIRGIADKDKPPMITPETRVKARAAYKLEVPSSTAPFDDSIKDIGKRELSPGDVEFPGPRHRMLTDTEWYLMTKDGCHGCGNPMTLSKDAWSTEWIETDQGAKPLCSSCIDIKSRDGDEELELSGGC
jgi:hypothetical protein